MAVRVTGPFISTTPSAAVEVLISPPRLIPESPVNATDLILLVPPVAAPIVPPIVIVLVPVPSVRVKVSDVEVPEIFPVIAIAPPALSIEKSPFMVRLPNIFTASPEVLKV